MLDWYLQSLLGQLLATYDCTNRIWPKRRGKKIATNISIKANKCASERIPLESTTKRYAAYYRKYIQQNIYIKYIENMLCRH